MALEHRPLGGAPRVWMGVDHLGHSICDAYPGPCALLPDGHPLIQQRLEVRAAFLGYAGAREMIRRHPMAGVGSPRPATAEEVAGDRTPAEVAQMYGYPSVEEMRLCESTGREVDDETDAAAGRSGMSGGQSWEREARLAVLGVAERRWVSVVEQFAAPERPRSSLAGWAAPGPAHGGFVRWAQPDKPPVADRVLSQPDGTTRHGPERVVPLTVKGMGRLRVAPVGETFSAPRTFTEVGWISADGFTGVHDAPEARHELAVRSMWRNPQDEMDFAGSAECECGMTEIRSAAQGGPEAAQAAIDSHVAEWSENRLSESLRKRLKASGAAVEELRERLRVLQEQQTRVVTELRGQVATAQAMVRERTVARDRFRGDAARAWAAVAEACAGLGDLDGVDAAVIRVRAVQVRERLGLLEASCVVREDAGEA